MKVAIVDENDTVIGAKERSELDYSKDILRGASLWITNSNSDVLLAKRKSDKKIDPGKWGEAVGGTIEDGDTYESTLRREAAEELGLHDITFRTGPKQFIDSSAKYFVQWYTAEIDMPISDFVIQHEEVEAIAWIPMHQLEEELQNHSPMYIPAMKSIVDLLK